MKRIPLKQRVLPRYSAGEETMNMITHIVGGGISAVLTVMLWIKAFAGASSLTITGCLIYGISLLSVYCMSSIYHGLKPGTAKKVMQVIDHCMIYLLIAGTYTPVLLAAFVPHIPPLGWGLLSAQWGLGILAATLTAIDLKKYQVFSMICYILMGWAIIFFLPATVKLLSPQGFAYLLAGGIAYTIGAVLYGIGSKKKWIHSVFHIFVVIGSVLQFISIYCYIL